jgi:putative IMPACT (imprinted ancient) family translation regulator
MALIPLGESLSQIEILSSRFIAFLLPLNSSEGKDALLKEVEERFPKASHYCYAAISGVYEACSDDGEPPHTAGLPLLTLLKRRNIGYALLVVVRYFGGTKLGLPRLKRTYSEVAEACLKQATFAELIPGIELELRLDYSLFEREKRAWESQDCSYQVLDYGEKVRLLWRGDAKLATSLKETLRIEELLSEHEIVYSRRMKS